MKKTAVLVAVIVLGLVAVLIPVRGNVFEARRPLARFCLGALTLDFDNPKKGGALETFSAEYVNGSCVPDDLGAVLGTPWKPIIGGVSDGGDGMIGVVFDGDGTGDRQGVIDRFVTRGFVLRDLPLMAPSSPTEDDDLAMTRLTGPGGAQVEVVDGGELWHKCFVVITWWKGNDT